MENEKKKNKVEEEIWVHEEEVWRKYSRRRGRPWTSKTKAQERPKKKIKRESEAENWLKERRSREDYDLEPQAEQEEGMKKYSESKKAGSRDGERSAGRARGEK